LRIILNQHADLTPDYRTPKPAVLKPAAGQMIVSIIHLQDLLSEGQQQIFLQKDPLKHRQMDYSKTIQ